MPSRHFWLPEYQLTSDPLPASREIVQALQTLHGIEFTSEARDLFEDAFRLVIEDCAQERETAVGEVKDDLQEKLDEAEDNLKDEEAAHKGEILTLNEKHKEALEDIAIRHRDEVARLQAEHEADILDLENKHKGELLRAKVVHPIQIRTVEGHTVLVRRRASPSNAWKKILSSEE